MNVYVLTTMKHIQMLPHELNLVICYSHACLTFVRRTKFVTGSFNVDCNSWRELFLWYDA